CEGGGRLVGVAAVDQHDTLTVGEDRVLANRVAGASVHRHGSTGIEGDHVAGTGQGPAYGIVRTVDNVDAKLVARPGGRAADAGPQIVPLDEIVVRLNEDAGTGEVVDVHSFDRAP